MTKFIKDPVYDDFLKFTSDELKLIDLPEFKRLKRIKQLGALDEVFPNANHTRFAHSLGVAHLSEQYFKNILKNSDMDKKFIRHVKIAGLYHDIGHGPFSHVFDNIVLKKICPNNPYSKHEYRSQIIFENLIKKININNFSGYDVDIIKNMINPSKNKSFYYNQIVNNSINSLDTDKIDYLMRDSYQLGFKHSFDYRKLFNKTKLISINDSKNQICYHENEANNIFDIFYTRYKFHREIYNHKTVKSIELMISDILLMSNDVYNYSSIIQTDEFLDLDDNILTRIKYNPEKKLDKCRTLLNRIETRNLYKEIYKTNNSDISFVKDYIQDTYNDNNIDDFHFVKLNFDLCNGSQSPLENINFYKNTNEIINKNNIFIRKLIPKDFDESLILVYKK